MMLGFMHALVALILHGVAVSVDDLVIKVTALALAVVNMLWILWLVLGMFSASGTWALSCAALHAHVAYPRRVRYHIHLHGTH